MSKTIRPFSAQDCIKIVKEHQAEIEKGNLVIDFGDWIDQLPDDVLTFLALNGNIKKRAVVIRLVKNPTILRTLAKDSSEYIRSYVALNPNTPEDVLRMLAKDESEDVRCLLARNLNVPQDILRQCIDDDETVQASIAGNPKTSQEMLEMLARNSNPSIRETVACHPNTSSKILEFLSEDNYDWSWEGPSDRRIQNAVAENSNTPIHVLKKFATNPNRYSSRVREEAIRRLAQKGIYYNNDGTEQQQKEGCFIATMCYGSYEAPEVVVFRTYRDEVLSNNFWGRLLISLYYSYSPYWSDKIRKRTTIKRIIKYVLDKLFMILSE